MIQNLSLYLYKKSNKIIFNIRERIWTWVRGGYLYLCYSSRTRILKSRKTQTQSKRIKPVKLKWVRTDNGGYGF